MDKTTYRQELQEVRYTDAGREALVDRLMAAQAAEPPVQRKRWGRKGLVMILAAVLLVTAAAAVTAPAWISYFGGLNEEQRAVVESMETKENDLTPETAEEDGVSIIPLSILGSRNQVYVLLEIHAPEGTVFSEEKGRYDLFGGVRPKVIPEGMMAASTSRFTVLEAGVQAPNILTGVYEESSSCDLGGGTLKIRGIDLYLGRGEYEHVLSGEWKIPIPEDLGGDQVLEPQVEGVRVETEFGTFTLDSISVSPLGVWWQYHFDGKNEPVLHVALGMADGSRVEVESGQMFTGAPGYQQSATASFEKPVDLSRAVSLYWGNMEIPLDGQGGAKADETVPALSNEPPFFDLPAGEGENGGAEEMPASDGQLGPWKRELHSGEVVYSISGGLETAYSQAPAWRPTWLPEGWTMDGIFRMAQAAGAQNTGVYIMYRNGKDTRLAMKCFRPVERSCMDLYDTGSPRQAAEVQGCDADFYQKEDSGLLVWADSAGNLFKLEGNLDRAVLEKIANSVAEVSKEAMPDYQLGWTPEGCLRTSRTTAIPGAVSETWEDAGETSFGWLCVRGAELAVPAGTPETVEVNGIPAQFWTGARDGGLDIERGGGRTHIYTEEQKNVLRWTVPETNVTFRIQGMMEKADLIRMAESIAAER